MVDTVQTPPQNAQLTGPISTHLQHLFSEDIQMPERVDWKAKSNQFLEDLARDGYVVSNQSQEQHL